MLRAVALGLVATTACASASDQASQLKLRRMSVGAKIELADLDVTGLAATYLIPSESNPAGFDRVIANPRHDGSWTSSLRQPAPVLFEMPDYPAPIPRMWAFPNLVETGLWAVLEHPHPVPASASATITISTTLDTPLVATESFEAYTVGAWSERPFAAAELPAVGSTQLGPVTYPFATATSRSGRPLDQLAAADAFLVLRYVGTDLTGAAITDRLAPSDAMTIDGTMQRVAHDQTLVVTFDQAAIANRLATVQPAVTSPHLYWNLNAAPGYRIASNTGPSLQSGVAQPTDSSLEVPFGNPFVDRGWNTILTFASYATRSYTPPGTATPATLYAGLQELIEPRPGEAMSFPAPLPTTISLGGIVLAADGTTVPLPTKFVDASFAVDLPGTTLYQLQLFELVPDPTGTALIYQIAFAAAGTQPIFHLPPEVLQQDHRYVVRALCTLGGFPTLADGRLDNRELPLYQGFADSGVFVVH